MAWTTRTLTTLIILFNYKFLGLVFGNWDYRQRDQSVCFVKSKSLVYMVKLYLCFLPRVMTRSTIVPGAGLLILPPTRLNKRTLIRFMTTMYAKAGSYGLSPSNKRVFWLSKSQPVTLNKLENRLGSLGTLKTDLWFSEQLKIGVPHLATSILNCFEPISI